MNPSNEASLDLILFASPHLASLPKGYRLAPRFVVLTGRTMMQIGRRSAPLLSALRRPDVPARVGANNRFGVGLGGKVTTVEVTKLS